jgi:hypothetical protein
MDVARKFIASCAGDELWEGRQVPRISECFKIDGTDITYELVQREYFWVVVDNQSPEVTAYVRKHCGIPEPYNNVISSLKFMDGSRKPLYGIKYTIDHL